MKEITQEDYERYVKDHKELIFKDRIGKREVVIRIGEKHRIRDYGPKGFELEGTTVWSYPRRGTWATHKGDYRGNWPPQMARNIILRYSKPGEWVLDQMVGSGTTLIECKLLGRNGIGVDVNPACIYLTRDRLNFSFRSLDPSFPETVQRTYVGDARNLNEIEDASIDLIATHPPYASIIPYSKERVPGDLSYVHSVDEYVEEIRKVAEESFRVLKPGRYCAILVGDTRRNKHYVPIAFRVMQAFLDVGFILKEDVIKHQWRCKATPFWLKRSIEYNFLLIMHEHLFVFRKPGEGERLERFKESMKWW
ncbi:DNA methylase [Candidatus Bathyarchaeota archaeon]|nr:MAG: DNA methylase [Candidatus Bathyarchaeota archaeon]